MGKLRYMLPSYFRRDGHLHSADDVVITDVESAGTNAVQFSVYVQSNDGVLSGNALLNAVQVDSCTH